MNELRWLLLALALFLVALPALSLGTDGELPALWWTGLVLTAAAGIVPVALRFAPADGEED